MIFFSLIEKHCMIWKLNVFRGKSMRTDGPLYSVGIRLAPFLHSTSRCLLLIAHINHSQVLSTGQVLIGKRNEWHLDTTVNVVPALLKGVKCWGATQDSNEASLGSASLSGTTDIDVWNGVFKLTLLEWRGRSKLRLLGHMYLNST